MADSSSSIICSLELRLLQCSLSPPSDGSSYRSVTTSNNSTHYKLAEEVVGLIQKGDYLGAISSNAAHLIFDFAHLWIFENSVDCADRFYLEVQNKADSFLQDDDDGDLDSSWRAFLLMSVAIAAFLAFTQNNVTGPCESFPSLPFPFLLQKEDEIMFIGSEWDVWARNQLTNAGADLCGKFSLLQYIVYAKMLLFKTKDFLVDKKDDASFTGFKSVSWWLSRLILLQQRILEDHTTSLFDLLQVLKAETMNYFGQAESVESYWGSLLHKEEAIRIVSMAHLEAGILEYTYGRVDQSMEHFDTAEEASGLQISVTGMLGFRSLHQVEAKVQQVLVTNSVPPCADGVCPASSEVQTNGFKSGDDKSHSSSHEVIATSDILMTPKLLENKKGDSTCASGAQTGGTKLNIPLGPIQQALVLTRCLVIEKSAHSDELQRWNMAPFIEAVDAQEFSYYMIRCFCDILRIRWESTRSRTKERALLMMEKKVQGANQSSPGAVNRIPYSFCVYVPTIPEMRKEFGELLVGCGLIGEALNIFEDLELWDNLIHCYSLLEKKAAAVELIEARLRETPNDPRLWCSLGDVTNFDTHYEKALEVSNGRSARAKRSLARSAYNRGDYHRSKILWESALALNYLHPDGWFAFGAAALKDRDMEKALEGFSHAVQLNPDNGEAWNNLACLHMIKKNDDKAFVAFREALKFRRKNWQMWENFSQVAVNIGNFDQALEATMMVLDMTKNKRVKTDLLETIMIEIESRIAKPNLTPTGGCAPDHSTRNDISDSSASSVTAPLLEGQKLEWSRETKHLVELLGKVLQQCIRSGMGGEIWGLYARWHKIKGDLRMCSEALLKQVRSYQGADLWNNRDRFKSFANASLQLCEVYMDIARSSGNQRELNAAEMHLRSTVKQAAVSFSELEEFQALQSCLEEVRKRQHASSVASARDL